MTQGNTEQLIASIIGGAVIFLLVFMAVMFAVTAIIVIAQWKIFSKAGEHGWAALIPFYNQYTMVKITWGNGWLFLLYLVPLGSLVFGIATCMKLARSFGKSGGYAAGLFFLPFIFQPMLGFGKAEYQGPDENRSKGVIIATAVVGGVYILILVISGIAGTMAVVNQQDLYPTDYIESQNEVEPEDRIYGATGEDTEQNEDDQNDYYQDVDTSKLSAIDGSEHFVNVELSNENGAVQIPILDSEYLSVYDTNAVSMDAGVTTSLNLSYLYDDDLSQKVADSVSMRIDSLESLTDYYQNVTTDELILGDGFALQQINYDAISYDGTVYPSFEIIKCDATGATPVMLMLTVDNSMATDETQDIFKEACELYGIDFDYTE